ncbi:MAG: HAMP domain-containing sensor histidine kinase [Anaerolineae bacterium]|nr:HAMP domain-containing sensor histidine kinase [Anaerolineae bacterium]
MAEAFYTPEEELRERIDWLIRLGWLTVLGALFIVLVVSVLLPGVLAWPSLLGAIVGLSLSNLVVFFYFRHLHFPLPLGEGRVRVSQRHYLGLAHALLVLNTLFLTALLHFLGGLETPLFIFYLIYVVIASTLFPRSSSFAYAGLVSGLYLVLLLLEWFRVIPHYNLTGFRSPLRFQQPVHVFVTSITLIIAAFATAYFVSRIVSRLRARERELMEANLSCEMRGEELTELNKRLREMDKARTQFIRVVTHELRAPVAAIQSYLKLILEGYVPPEKEREIIRRAEQRALDQLALIGDLLYMARLEEPGAEAKVESVDLAQVLREVGDLLRGQAEEKGLTFRVEIAPDVPPVNADLEHIKQLWMNLISNAIKYTMAGGSVVVSLSRNARGIMGTVQDTGIGISPEDLPRIFEQFYRAENAKALEQHGTGLGLSIVKRIVETYGGRIWVESEPGKGSTFTFLLPAGTSV